MATPKETRRWGWAILLTTAGTSLAFNIGHAVAPADELKAHNAAHHSPDHVALPLALLYGICPVVVAMLLSHLIALKGGSDLSRRVAPILVFLAAMALSIRSIYEVLEPLAGPWGFVFAGMLDVASLVALNEILSASKKTDEETAQETAETGSQDRPETGSQSPAETLWRPVRETNPGAPQETVSGPVSEPVPAPAEQHEDATPPTSGDRAETGSQGEEKTDARPVRKTGPRTVSTSSRTRGRKTGQDRDELIRELNAKHLAEHGRPISADKLVDAVRAKGHRLGKQTALQILADLNHPPTTLTAVK